MKTSALLKAVVFLLAVFTLASFTPVLNTSGKTSKLTFQEEEMKVNAIYDGHEDYGYNFIAKDDEDEEYTITFQEIKDELLKEFDLKSETLIGKSFSVTYKTRIEVTTDDDGFENEEEINTIIKLKKL